MLACYYAATDLGGAPHDESAVLVWTYTAGKILALAETAHGDADAGRAEGMVEGRRRAAVASGAE